MKTFNIAILENSADSFVLSNNSREEFMSYTVDETSVMMRSNIQAEWRKRGLHPNASAADFLDFAQAIYTADQVISRRLNGYQGWSRHIRVHFPVSDLGQWHQALPKLEQMLSFLSGDKWELAFRRRTNQRMIQHVVDSNPDGVTKVCLFSGGLDSFIGAIDLLASGEKLALVSHYKGGSESVPQTQLYTALGQHFGNNTFLPFQLYVQPKQSNVQAQKEDTSRARSFLFLAIGIVLANTYGSAIPLIVPENGLISLNVPLTPTRVSSHSTRTTHPHYMALFQEIVGDLGISNLVENPYRFKTKGEMMQECKDQAFLLANYGGSMSCSHPDNSRYEGQRPGIHCGYCVPCIIRQSAETVAGGIHTSYTHNVRTSPPAASSDKGSDLRAFKIALLHTQNLRRTGLLFHILRSGPISFTSDQELSQYKGVYTRGMNEVRNFLS
ncbi:MAG: Qat anti-phage system QueC-like protein QatC [Flavisolibacter sp.]